MRLLKRCLVCGASEYINKKDNSIVLISGTLSRYLKARGYDTQKRTDTFLSRDCFIRYHEKMGIYENDKGGLEEDSKACPYSNPCPTFDQESDNFIRDIIPQLIQSVED